MFSSFLQHYVLVSSVSVERSFMTYPIPCRAFFVCYIVKRHVFVKGIFLFFASKLSMNSSCFFQVPMQTYNKRFTRQDIIRRMI
jgi:hypothetical protein